MWLDHLAVQLRQGLDGVRAELEAGEFESARQSEPALARFTLPELVEFGRWPTTKGADQDAVWLAIVRCCRHRGARIWTPVLLQMLAPAIINEAYRLALAVLRIDPVEVQQQLLAEVLAAAASLPLDERSRGIQTQLVKTAARRVEDWIRRTTERQPLSLDQWRTRRVVTSAANAEEALWLVAELRASRLAAADLELVMRVGVLRQDHIEVARALGIRSSMVLPRLRRARRRLRWLLAA
jgi:hypothetical protein